MEVFQIRPSAAMIAVTMILLLACSEASPASSSPPQQQSHTRKMLNASASSPAAVGGAGGSLHSGRRVNVDGCSDPAELVSVYQNSDSSLHTGMPAYTVEISNNCIDCTVCDVHLSCGDFANTELVDPATFRRLGFDDCLVKDGGPIGPGEMVDFQYANSFLYKMNVLSASCC
uniref:Uncharacterized protein n=1 Tax=Avena sativa TaxID=4498 RepID=A0ACD6A4L2_AVESA